MADEKLEVGGYTEAEWRKIDLEMAYEQAFRGDGPIGMLQSVNLEKHAKRFQELTEGVELDLEDHATVTALTTAANIIADSENKKK